MRLSGSDPLDLFAETGRSKTDSEDEPRWEAGDEASNRKEVHEPSAILVKQSAISKNGLISSNKET